jgi:hypothetical protein
MDVISSDLLSDLVTTISFAAPRQDEQDARPSSKRFGVGSVVHPGSGTPARYALIDRRQTKDIGRDRQ